MSGLGTQTAASSVDIRAAAPLSTLLYKQNQFSLLEILRQSSGSEILKIYFLIVLFQDFKLMPALNTSVIQNRLIRPITSHLSGTARPAFQRPVDDNALFI